MKKVQTVRKTILTVLAVCVAITAVVALAAVDSGLTTPAEALRCGSKSCASGGVTGGVTGGGRAHSSELQGRG